MTLDHGLDEPSPVVLVGDVARDGVGTRDLLAQRREPVRAPRGQDRDRAGLGERARECSPRPELAPVTITTCRRDLSIVPRSLFDVSSGYASDPRMQA